MTDARPDAGMAPPALRRCPGCRNQISTRTPRCPVCGKHVVTARVASAARWTLIAAGTAAVGWWWHHR